MQLHSLLKQELDARHMTQQELSRLTGIRPSTINDLYHDSRTCINKEHLGKVAEALHIDDIRRLFILR